MEGPGTSIAGRTRSGADPRISRGLPEGSGDDRVDDDADHDPRAELDRIHAPEELRHVPKGVKLTSGMRLLMRNA